MRPARSQLASLDTLSARLPSFSHLLAALDELDRHQLARRLVLHQLGDAKVAGPDVLDLVGWEGRESERET